MATPDTDSGNEKAPIPTTGFVHSLLHGPTDTRIAHLNKILATSSGTDSVLTLVGYSLYLVAAQLNGLENLTLRAFLSKFVRDATSVLRPGETLVAEVKVPNALSRVAELQIATKTLAGMCSDFRAFTRLWGLLGVYAAVKRTYLDPPKDAVLNAVAWSQHATLAAYLVYENGYYLAGKGVLRGWAPEKQKKWAMVSLRMFLAYVVIDWIRLFRTRQLREEKYAGQAESAEKKGEEAVWWRTAIIDGAYTPLAMHWAKDGGMLNDSWVGALMTLVGVVKVRAAWQQTA